MKFYLVNETNLYHECTEGRLDSLFSKTINGTYSCYRCKQNFPDWLFFPFTAVTYENQFHIFTKLIPIIHPESLKKYSILQITI